MSRMRRIMRRLRRMKARLFNEYWPYVDPNVDREQLAQQVSAFFGTEVPLVRDDMREYLAFSEKQGYAERFGELKTLSTEEAFIVMQAAKHARPAVVVEVGTQYGRSTRRILDMLDWLGLESRVVCFDVLDEVEYFEKGTEADLILEDVTGRFTEAVLEPYHPGLIFLDARPYYLIRDVVQSVTTAGNGALLAIHDCTAGLCNRKMRLPKTETNIGSNTGVWERHAIADVFGVESPCGPQLENVITATHHLRIFGTQHGLAVIKPL